MNRPAPREWRIDNELPNGVRPDWLFGAGATPAEKALIYGGAVGGTLVVLLAFQRPAVTGWAWWQTALGLLIAADLFGGAVSNAASSTKRQYQAPVPAGTVRLTRVAHHPVGFAALHVYPFVVVLLYPGGTWWWAAGWYLGMLLSVAVVTYAVPTYLQRPTAMALYVLACAVAVACPSPAGWEWLPFVFMAKLLLGHAVHEEAYRPDTDPVSSGPGI